MYTGIKTYKILTHITYRFLWADLQLNEICKQTSDTGIKKTLKQIPKDLNATYERILDSTKKESQAQYELARKVLICLAYSRSPIQMDFLRYAVSVEDDSEVLEALESSRPTETKILEVCTNLISIDKDKVVRFVHFSVQEFLTNQSCIGPFDLGPESAHREIARMLITLLKNIYSGTLENSLLHHEEILHEWQFHLLPADLGTLSVDHSMVALVTSFFEQSPPIPISIPNQNAPAYFRFSPSALALIFQVPLGISVYRHYQPQSVYWKTLSNEHLHSIYPKSTHPRPLIIIFDDRFAMHYAVIVLGSVPVAQRLCNHSYPIDWFYNGLAQPARNFWSLPTIIYTFRLYELFDKIPPPLYFAKCEKMAMFLFDNSASTNPQPSFVFSALLHDPLVHFAEVGNIQLTKLISDRIVYQHAQRHNTALQTAAFRGNVGCIHLLLDKGADVNAEGGEYGTALQAAVPYRNVECIQLLLNRGADVNAEGGEYGTALQAAAYGGNVECMQLLLDKGADVNAEGGKYGTALQAAAYWGNVECLRLLLDKGVDVNAEGGEYGTALQAAAYWGNVECIQLLLDKGVDVNAKGGKYGTALQAAVCRGNVECIQLLLDKGVDANAEGGEYGTALQAAASKGNVECIRLLLDKGVDFNTEGGKYGTALQAAASKGNVECIQLLLDKGVDVNAEGGEYGTALQAAAYEGNVECIRLLLDKGADVNAEGGEYGTALQAAACRGNAECIRLLLNKGVDVNAEGGEYGTALQAAACRGNVECIRLLLDKGVDNAEGGEYGTALQIAAYWGNVECIQLLLDKGVDVNTEGEKYGTALQAAGYSGATRKFSCRDTEMVAYEEDDHSVQCIQLLLDHGADINATCGKYGTALQAAAFNYRIHSIRLLLDKGADVNAEGGEYGTALQAASYACHLEVVKELLSNGANVNARVGKYGTALQAALAPAPEDNKKLRVQKNQYSTFDVLELLLDNGADITAYVEDSEFGDALTAAKHSWKNDKESLDRFMKHWESGKRKGGQTTKCSR